MKIKPFWAVLPAFFALSGSIPLAAQTGLTLYFAHFAEGEGVVSMLVLGNPSRTRTISGTAKFYDQDGNPWSVPVTGETSRSSVSFEILPSGSWTLATEGEAEPMQIGWVAVEADGPVGGHVAFNTDLGPSSLAAAHPAEDFIIPIGRASFEEERIAVAIANPNEEENQVRLMLYDAAGSEIPDGQVSLTIPPQGQVAGFWDEILEEANLAEFQGSLRLTGDSPLVFASLRLGTQGMVTLHGVPSGDRHVFSFENGLGAWQPRSIDLELGDTTIDWSISTSQDRAVRGDTSVRLFLDNLNDAGKIWIQKPFAVRPNRSYRVTVSYAFGTADWGDVNLWRIIAGASERSPERVDDLVFQGNTGSGADSATGYEWLHKEYEFQVESGEEGVIHVFVGVWGTWETDRDYYIDDLRVNFEQTE